MNSNMLRTNIKIGGIVDVVEKQNQRSGKLTRGEVYKILTNSLNHTRGIKVMLSNGIVGRVQKIISE
ncbi:MAG: YwbE family protein [Bacilli bacterium]